MKDNFTKEIEHTYKLIETCMNLVDEIATGQLKVWEILIEIRKEQLQHLKMIRGEICRGCGKNTPNPKYDGVCDDCFDDGVATLMEKMAKDDV